jgi:hypothetical protein
VVSRENEAGTVRVALARAPLARSQCGVPSDDRLKAGFLSNSAKCIDWPENSFANRETTFAICVLATDRFKRVVGGNDGCAASGRMIEFTLEKSHVRFAITPALAGGLEVQMEVARTGQERAPRFN